MNRLKAHLVESIRNGSLFACQAQPSVAQRYLDAAGARAILAANGESVELTTLGSQVKRIRVVLDAPDRPACIPGAITEEEAEAEIARLFAGLGASLAKAKSMAKKKDLIRAAYDRHVEVQAASGHPTPEAYFTHRFGEFGLGEYGMLAVDAIE